MIQSILSFVIDVQPQSAGVLNDHIERLRLEEAATTPPFSRLQAAVPLLHFMSMSVCPSDAYDPVFVIEVNFDGKPGPFWHQLEAAIGPQLRQMLRCVKTQEGSAAALLAAITAPGSSAPIAPLLEACTVKPAAAHRGNRGLDRPRIEREAALFGIAQVLADDPQLWGLSASAVHASLRGNLLGQFPWLNEPAKPRIGKLESLNDWVAALVLASALLICPALPGLALALAFKTLLLPLLLALTAAYSILRILDLNGADGRASRRSQLTGVAALLMLGANLYAHFAHGAGSRLLAGLVLSTHDGRAWWFWVLTGITSQLATLALLLQRVRMLERADPVQDGPPRDDAVQRQITHNEDRVVQSHMISIVNIKPGVLRAVLIRVAMMALGYRLRIVAHDGYLLHRMRTIHFAHWALISNGSRVLFHSNFDGSWESYLDDFIEKVHWGLTLAWTNTVGFPKTRLLVLEGATHGRAFKAWARHSMSASQLWFTAYKNFTVNQIERQSRVAAGLAHQKLTEKEAEAWLLDL